MGDVWFGSSKAAIAAAERDMEVVHQIKSNYACSQNSSLREA